MYIIINIAKLQGQDRNVKRATQDTNIYYKRHQVKRLVDLRLSVQD